MDQTQTPPPTPTFAPRWTRLLAGMSLAWAGWYVMMVVHEAGHVLTALLTDGRIEHVQLSPIGLSQTHLSQNPQPLWVVWAGPIFGIVFPLIVWLCIKLWAERRKSLRIADPITFVAGLCLIANGAYLGLGWIDRIGDAGDMMRLGTPVFAMIVFGALSTAGGFAIWHTLGSVLGLNRLTAQDARHLTTASLIVVAIGFVTGVLLEP